MSIARKIKPPEGASHRKTMLLYKNKRDLFSGNNPGGHRAQETHAFDCISLMRMKCI